MSWIPLLLIALLWLNSVIAQIFLPHAYHPLSYAALAYWTVIYTAIGFGLFRRTRVAYWFGLLLSLLQLLPALLWTYGGLAGKFGGTIPGWYSISLWVSFGLGLGLFVFLIASRFRTSGGEASPTNH